MPTPQAEAPSVAASPGGRMISLREAERLSGRSERTLRRKMEAEELRGDKKDLDYGGKAWIVDLESLLALYPDIQLPPSYPRNEAGSAEQRASEKPAAGETADVAAPGGGEQQQPSPGIVAGFEDDGATGFLAYLKERNAQLEDRIADLQGQLVEAKQLVGRWEGSSTTEQRYNEILQREFFALTAENARLKLLAANTPPSMREAREIVDVEARIVAATHDGNGGEMPPPATANNDRRVASWIAPATLGGLLMVIFAIWWLLTKHG